MQLNVRLADYGACASVGSEQPDAQLGGLIQN